MFDAKGCTMPVIGHDGSPHPCGLPIVAFLRQSDRDGGGGYRGVCQRHARQTGVILAPLAEIPDPPPFALAYEDYDGGTAGHGRATTVGRSDTTPADRTKCRFASNARRIRACSSRY